MDALKKSIADKGARPQAKKGKKRIEGQREMLLPISGKKGGTSRDEDSKLPRTEGD